jgi:hypothetical protein
MKRWLALTVGALWISAASCSGSSELACGQVTPCGGDVVGSWSIVRSCLSPTGMFASDQKALFAQFCAGTASSSSPAGSASPVSDDQTSASWTGAWSFSATTSYTVSILATVHESFTCDDGETCQALDSEIKAAQSTTATIQSAGCTAGSGSGRCNCTLVWASLNDESGSYVNQGTALSLAATGVSTAQIGYCVQGNTMHWIPTDSVASGPPYPDVVAERQ